MTEAPVQTGDTREQLLHLLAEAAEFEHNLLCCYLYAAFSLKADRAEDLTEPELDAVRRWRSTIVSVAVEEMGHLAIVANLTVALGARPHFNRPNFPVAPGYHPARVVVELAPFDNETLRHFIFLERPSDVALSDSAAFENDVECPREPPARGLMPGAFDYDTTAGFYEGIRGTLIAAAERSGATPLFVGPPDAQLSPEVVSLPGMAVIRDLDSALAALGTIVEQGEGAATGRDDSHFQRFTSIARELDALRSRRPAFRPARPCARNPVMRRPADPAGRVHVDHPDASAVLDLANALYNQMLRALTQSYDCGPDGAREGMVGVAIDLMKVFGEVGSFLSSLPARVDDGSVNAGVTFTTLRSTEPLVRGAEFAVLADRLHELARGSRALASRFPQVAHVPARLTELARRISGAGVAGR